MKNAELKRFYAAVAALVMASGTTVTAFAEEVADAGTAAETSAAEVKTETSDYSGNYGKDVNWKYDPESKTFTVSGKGRMDYENGDVNLAFFYMNHKWVEEVEKIVIEDGVESIQDLAFAKFASAKSVSIPESVKEMGYDCFCNCISLEEVTIPSGVTIIPTYAFKNCNELKKVDLPDGLEWIGSEAFKGCCSLVSVHIPEGVKRIDEEAFKHCLKLREINLPESVEQYGENIFDWVDDNEYLRIKVDGPNGRSYAYRNGCLRFEADGVVYSDTSGICGEFVDWSFDRETGVLTFTGTGMADYAPYNSEWVGKVKKIIVGEGITGMGCNGLGYYFTGVESVTLPESFKGFTEDTLCGLSDLAITSIDLPDKMKVINQGMLQNCTNLKEVKMPAKLEIIGDFAFASDSSLESIVIPEKTDKIGEYAFDACGLKSVTFMNKYVRIDDTAFYLCDPSMVIIAKKGSTAEEYAEKHGFQFQVLGEEKKGEDKKVEAVETDVKTVALAAPVQADTAETTVKLGDADGSGVVDISDISMLSLALVDGTELTDEQKKALDVDGDGDVDLADLAKLRQYLSKKIEKL